MLMVKKWLTLVPCRSPKLIGIKPKNFAQIKRPRTGRGLLHNRVRRTQYFATTGVPQLK